MSRPVSAPAAAVSAATTGSDRPLGRLLPAPRVARRSLHPWAWWGWAIGAAVVATASRNPLLLLLVAASVTWVVVARRSDAVWARSARTYLLLAGFVLAVRFVFQMLLGGLRDGHVLFTLPQVQLPEWVAGIQIGGPVTLEALWFTLCDAGRLAVLLWCVGAANTLSNPRRALRNLPHAMHRVATAVAIAVSVAPQLVESTQRVARARRLRGAASGRRHAVRAVVVPVLEDAVERSLRLAASMESRGFGRSGRPTRHRPDPWRAVDTATVLCGVAAAALVLWQRHANRATVWPAVSPIGWPALTLPMVVAVVALSAPALFTPLPERVDA